MIKFMHTRVRVRDLDKTVNWYCDNLGFVCTRRTEKSPAGNELAFLELEGNEHFLELCYSPDYEVNVPEDLMHTCIGVSDIIGFCHELEKKGVEVWPDDWRQTFLQGRKMAFVTDPDGYEVEILEIDDLPKV
ncbi:MAG: glyoxalase [Opitutaceae bacterium]|nr:glyoxalase [Opitutaceae bacterium]|tara:strand:- start:2528 stop:2923 length:396 start_codon:yes stop_codon:yes gene_type:complete